MRGSISNDADDSLAGETAEGRGRSGNDDRQCTQCGMVFCSAGNLRRHVKARHQAFIFPCDFCGAAFNRSDNLRKHNREKHGLGAKSWTCFRCLQAFPSRVLLTNHISNCGS